jgi:predicted ribosomally synthesized peptide with nif11-like leader
MHSQDVAAVAILRDNLRPIMKEKYSMSVENATAFLNVFSANPSVRTQLYVMNPKKLADFLRYAHAKTGYSFSKEDLQAALASFNSSSVKQLKQRYSL